MFKDSEDSNLTEQYCNENGVLIATSLYYRLSLLVTVVTSIFSATFTIFFLYRFHNKSPFFHKNLKTLFFSLCICCLTYSIINFAMKGHHLTLTFLHSTSCQIFLPRLLYAFMLISSTSTYLITEFMLFAIVVERWIAFIFCGSYETGYTKMAPLLIAVAVLTPSTLLFIVFYGQNFDGLYLNGRNFPSNTYTSANVLLFALLATNITGLLLTVILHLLTPKRQIRTSLSSKFQSKENVIASTLLFWISTAQFTALCCSHSVLLYLRIYQTTNPMLIAFKENSDFFNYYTLALPVMSTLYFVKVKQQRIRDIKSHVNMKASGSDGWTNYSSVIERQWR
uniref:Serpentine Receptor, class T n=1 Tax=Haemonchus contortus TaxID=6289 RepID=A0A7I4YRU3_HAECO